MNVGNAQGLCDGDELPGRTRSEIRDGTRTRALLDFVEFLQRGRMSHQMIEKIAERKCPIFIYAGIDQFYRERVAFKR